MSTEENLKRWLDGSLTQAEKEAFEQTEEYRRLNRLLNATQRFRAPDFPLEPAYERLRANLTSTSRPIAKQAWLFPLLRVAAVLVLVAGGLGYLFYNPSTELVTRDAEHAETYLPDSTQVILNAVTSIRYRPRQWSEKRSVELEGEAFFNVRKGSTFQVSTRLGMVTVLGTQFNVRIRDNHLEVTCYHGSVRVNAGQQETVLTPGMTFFARNALNKTEVRGIGPKPSWLNRESSFESLPLADVIQELERQYGVEVTTRNVDTTKLFTGRFTHDDLNIALESIAYPLHLTFTISADQKHAELAGENR